MKRIISYFILILVFVGIVPTKVSAQEDVYSQYARENNISEDCLIWFCISDQFDYPDCKKYLSRMKIRLSKNQPPVPAFNSCGPSKGETGFYKMGQCDGRNNTNNKICSKRPRDKSHYNNWIYVHDEVQTFEPFWF